MRAPPVPVLSFNIEAANLEALEGYSIEMVTQAVERGAFEVANGIKARWLTKVRDIGGWDTGKYELGVQTASVVFVSRSVQMPIIQVVIDVVNTAPHAAVVEDGHMAFHLPDKIDWGSSPNVKTFKNGTRYITVPFRHYTPRKGPGITKTAERAMMPAEVYNQAKKLVLSERLMQGRQVTPSGQFVAADRYNWGGRMERLVPVGHKVGGILERRGQTEVAPGMVNPAWGSSKFHGMVKFGPVRGESYRTFRILTEHSVGWNIPAQAGRHIAADVAREAERDSGLQDLFAAGIAGVVVS